MAAYDEGEDVDWEQVDAECQQLIDELYGGRLPTLAELQRDLDRWMQERQQQVANN